MQKKQLLTKRYFCNRMIYLEITKAVTCDPWHPQREELSKITHAPQPKPMGGDRQLSTFEVRCSTTIPELIKSSNIRQIPNT